MQSKSSIYQVNPLSAKRILRCFCFLTILQEVVASGHNKIMSSLRLPKILCWPSGPARYILLAQRASKCLKTLKWMSSLRVKYMHCSVFFMFDSYHWLRRQIRNRLEEFEYTYLIPFTGSRIRLYKKKLTTI